MKKNIICMVGVLSLAFPVFVFADSVGAPVNPGGNGSVGTSGVVPVPSGSGTVGAPVVPGSGTQSNSPSTFMLSNPLKFNSVGDIIDGFVTIFTYLVIILAVLMIIWTGLQYILASGNTEKMKEATKKLGWLVVGIAIVIGARVLVHIVINTLQATGTVNPNVINSANNALNNH